MRKPKNWIEGVLNKAGGEILGVKTYCRVDYLDPVCPEDCREGCVGRPVVEVEHRVFDCLHDLAFFVQCGLDDVEEDIEILDDDGYALLGWSVQDYVTAFNDKLVGEAVMTLVNYAEFRRQSGLSDEMMKKQNVSVRYEV